MPSPFQSVVPAFPVEFAVTLRELTGITVFVETGTYQGDTIVVLASHFARVLSIEGCRDRADAVLQREDLPYNVELWCGDSARWLRHVLNHVSGPAILFLDAHWIAAGKEPDQDGYQAGLSYCPLRGELEAVRDGDIVLIDDAHFFTHPPKQRGDDDQWLSLDQIVTLLPGRYVFIHEGMICAVPERLRVPMREWLQANWRGLDRYIENRRENGGSVVEMERQDEAGL